MHPEHTDSPVQVEEWRDVVGYVGFYEVSSLGRVRRDGRVLAGCVDRYGYVGVTLSRNGLTWTPKVHQLVARAFIRLPTGTEQVNHLDGNRSNNVLANLEWTTPARNVQHARDHGRLLSVPHAKRLTEAQEAEIRSLRGKLRQIDIAPMFGITQTHVSRIQRGLSNGH